MENNFSFSFEKIHISLIQTNLDMVYRLRYVVKQMFSKPFGASVLVL
jgi:hypothetical protein